MVGPLPPVVHQKKLAQKHRGRRIGIPLHHERHKNRPVHASQAAQHVAIDLSRSGVAVAEMGGREAKHCTERGRSPQAGREAVIDRHSFEFATMQRALEARETRKGRGQRKLKDGR